MKIKIKKKAMTIVELSVSVILAFILLSAIFKIFSSGMKESANVLTYQDNMETANILMSQIEYDLNRATEIVRPSWNEKDNCAQWIFQSKSLLGNITFSYDYNDNSFEGVHRLVVGKDIKEEHYFARGHPVKLYFTHIVLNFEDIKNNKWTENHGMWVELDVGSIKGEVATYSIKRFIVINQ